MSMMERWIAVAGPRWSRAWRSTRDLRIPRPAHRFERQLRLIAMDEVAALGTTDERP